MLCICHSVMLASNAWVSVMNEAKETVLWEWFLSRNRYSLKARMRFSVLWHSGTFPVNQVLLWGTPCFASFWKPSVAFSFCELFLFLVETCDHKDVMYIIPTFTSHISLIIFLVLKTVCFPSVCFAWIVCRPCGRPARPVGRVSSAALQRILCFSPRQLRQRSQPAGARAPQCYHCW